MKTKTVEVFGDTIEITFDGSVWVAPTTGSQYSRPAQAMRVELESYLAACGEDLESPEILASIEDYLASME